MLLVIPFAAWLKENPNPAQDTILCDCTDDPPLGEEVYIVCCNLALVGTQAEDTPIWNSLVKWLAEDPTRDRTICDLIEDPVNPVIPSLMDIRISLPTDMIYRVSTFP